MTAQDTARSYDDLPESDVATVLQVPLLLTPGASDAQVAPAGRVARRQPGRHRAPSSAADHSRERPSRSRSRSSRSSFRRPWTAPKHRHLVAAMKVGLVAAALVLTVFAVVLLALAVWLP